MRVLLLGGAGFVGSSLAFSFKKENQKTDIVVFDNLKRRGSEINLPRFKRAGFKFIHGDIRLASDFDQIGGNFDLMIDASAEPSVLAGLDGHARVLLETNITGTINALEFARKKAKRFLFLSTSRVYSIPELKRLPLAERASRFEIKSRSGVEGLTSHGISENFSTRAHRSLYGASKLASELLVQEYCEAYGLKALINRCGVIAGPGQFGKVDQGVFTLWVAAHSFGRPLTYIGFGGKGKQVRDLLHPQDLFELISKQLPQFEKRSGEIFNVGGGMAGSVSLKELTDLCREKTGRQVPVGSEAKTNPVDVPFYVTDNRRVSAAFGWKPKHSAAMIVAEIAAWLRQHKAQLEPLFF